MKDKLTTNYYKVLEILCDNLVTINDEFVAVITQVEIAEKLGLSKITVNSIFKELKSDLLISSDRVIGRYKVSDKAINIVKKIKSI